MRVLFRADASVEIGTGHVVRCATLAETLQAQGMDVAFACRALPGNMLAWLQQKGITTFALDGKQAETLSAGTSQIKESVTELLSATQEWHQQEAIDWLVVDHYGLDARWESLMRAHCQRILAIDDLANRAHDCDLLLDQNLLDANSKIYQPWVPAHCRTLLSPHFALLRPEFRQLRENIQASKSNRQSSVTQSSILQSAMSNEPFRILILFGGSDPTRECFKALDALQQLPAECKVLVDLVAGASNPNFEALQTRCANLPQVRLHRQVTAMANLMSQMDLSIGAGGTTSWERLCLGIPGIIIAVADNQLEISRSLARENYHVYLGESPQVSASQLSQAILDLIRNPEQRERLSEQGMRLVDGLGVQRVVNCMLGRPETAESNESLPF